MKVSKVIRTNMPARCYVSSLTLAIAALSGSSVFAEELVLEEIITSAQKRAEGLQTVPISVSAVGGEKLEDTGITNLEQLSVYVPNFSMNQTGIGSTVTIRGISSGINQGFEQSVGQYVDGIYYGRAAASRAPFLDIERIEVLRGPQGTLFGKNSIAGAVSMVSARPTEEFEGSITGLYEPDHDEQDLRLVVSGPLSDNVRGRLAVLHRTMDGYMDNTLLGRDEKDEEEKIIRGSIEWDINDDLSLYFKAERTEFEFDGRNMEMINSVTGPGVPPGFDYISVLNQLQGILGRPPVDGDLDRVRDSNGDTNEDTVDNFVLEVDYNLGEHTLTFLSGWFEYDHEEVCDCDFTGASLFLADGRESYEQFSQEIRITSPTGGAFEYIGGLYYQDSELGFDDRLFVPTDSVLGLALPPLVGLSSRRDFDQESEVWALFFQGTWNINDDWRLTAGARYSQEDKEASREQAHIDAAGNDLGASNPFLNAVIGAVNIEAYDRINDSRDESAFTPLITLEWDVSEDTMLYATWTKGFKSGGFDVRSNAHPDPAFVSPGTSPALVGAFEFDEEEATNIELGGKFSLLNGAAEVNVALFHTSYEDLQVSEFDGILGFNVTNAAEATIYGLEVDGRWLMTDSFMLSGSLSYLDFEYDEFPNSQCYFGQPVLEPGNFNPATGLCDSSGKSKEYTPEWRATLIGDHRVAIGEDLELRTTVDLLYVDDYNWNPTLDPRSEQDAYIEVNARIGVGAENGKWEVALVGKNLTDEDVINYGNDAPLASLLTSGAGNAYYAFVNRGRTVALQAKYSF